MTPERRTQLRHDAYVRSLRGNSVIGVIILVAILAFMLIIGPALLVWGVNEMLEQAKVSTQIEWNFWSWLAGFAIIAVLKGSTTSSN